jgi:hypothetical protein
MQYFLKNNLQKFIYIFILIIYIYCIKKMYYFIFKLLSTYAFLKAILVFLDSDFVFERLGVIFPIYCRFIFYALFFVKYFEILDEVIVLKKTIS